MNFPAGLARQAAGLIPAAPAVILGGAGHMAHVDQPGCWITAVARFLGGRARREPGSRYIKNNNLAGRGPIGRDGCQSSSAQAQPAGGERDGRQESPAASGRESAVMAE